ncbi:MAG: TatD family hydrolase [Chloroflexota bacterium]|nr:TatD family hydrolase [Chloroflexota bacterium]
MYELIDTHAHLDEVQNLETAIEKARESGLIAIVAVGVDYESNYEVLEIAAKYEGFVFPALGCHPQNLGGIMAEIERNFRFIEDNIQKAVAIGEIGLDYHKKVRLRADKDTQKQVFKDVLEMARRFGKPVSVHSRYSWRDCFDLLCQSQIERAVFHWYSGPLSVLRKFIGEGFFASATPAVEYGVEHSQAIAETPLENLMLETDAPVVYRWGTEFAYQAEPANVATVLETVAGIKGIEPARIAEQATQNARTFFGLSIQGAE